MAKWTLAPTTGETVAALRDSLNQRIVDLDLILAELEQLESDLKGTPERSSVHAGILDMQGNAIVGLPRQPADVSSAISLAFVQSGDFLYSTTNTVTTKKRIEGMPAQRGAEIPTFAQTQQTINQALEALDAIAAPPRVADASDIGLADHHFARQLHTHQGVNLDAAQSVTARKTFVTDLLTPLVLGSVASGGTLTLKSTEHATKGKVLVGSSAYDEVNNRLGIQQTTPVDAVHISGALRLDTSTVSTYLSPLGFSIPTKINIPNFDPGAYGQCLALGLASSATATARVFTMLDERAAGHQPSFQLISPDETRGFGLTWNGQNDYALIFASYHFGILINGYTGGASFIIEAVSNQLGDYYFTTRHAYLGPNRATNPMLWIDGSAASAATGLKLTGAAAGSSVSLTAISSGANEALTIAAKGTGVLSLNTVAVTSTGQVGIGINPPATSAALDVTSTVGAVLLPRMTSTQRDALTAVNGMLIYNTTTAKFQGYEAGAWTNLI